MKYKPNPGTIDRGTGTGNVSQVRRGGKVDARLGRTKRSKRSKR